MSSKTNDEFNENDFLLHHSFLDFFFRGSVGVVLGSLVQDLAGWNRWLNRGCRDRCRWCRRDRLDDGCQVGGPAAASPQKVAYSE